MLLRGWWGSDDVVSPAGRRDMGVAEDDLCQRLGLMRQLGLKEEGSCRLLIGIGQYVSNGLWPRLVVAMVVEGSRVGWVDFAKLARSRRKR